MNAGSLSGGISKEEYISTKKNQLETNSVAHDVDDVAAVVVAVSRRVECDPEIAKGTRQPPLLLPITIW